MKKILIVNDLVDGGGVEKLMYTFADHWKKNHTVEFLIGNSASYQRSRIHKGFQYHYLCPFNRMLHHKGFRKLGSLLNAIAKRVMFTYLNSRKYNILVAMKEGKVTAHGLSIKSKRKIGWVHVDYKAIYWTHSIFGGEKNELKALKGYDHIICVAETVKRSLQDVIGDPGNLKVLYNPIDRNTILDMASKAAAAELSCYRREAGRTLFVTIGRLHYQKGYDLLLEACHELELENLPYELWIIGCGTDEKQLRSLACQHKLEHVKLLGELDNPFIPLKQADWFISSSRYEGYSLVSQEAAVLGIPVIATNCSGVRELLGEDNEFGIVIEQGCEAMYQAMKYVIGNNALQEFYAERIRKRSKAIDFDSRMADIDTIIFGTKGE